MHQRITFGLILKSHPDFGEWADLLPNGLRFAHPGMASTRRKSRPASAYDQGMVGALDKVSIRRLPVVEPPAPPDGGRIQTAAGELAQIVNGLELRYLAYVEFKVDAPILRGNHYHEHKHEFLYVISGRLRARYLDLDSGETAEVLLEAGDLVTVAPRCGHVYHPLEYSQAVEFSANAYDPADTLPYPLADSGDWAPAGGATGEPRP
jgi:mannose-6-phosphate isomerase-like protein (cupin superfamily)